MNREDLEQRLDYGERFGFVKATGSPDVLGWALLSKRKPAPITPFDPVEEPERFLAWERKSESLRQRPYFVAIIEQQRAIYETGEYESTEEFGQKESHYFATLVPLQGSRFAYVLRSGNGFFDLITSINLLPG